MVAPKPIQLPSPAPAKPVANAFLTCAQLAAQLDVEPHRIYVIVKNNFPNAPRLGSGKTAQMLLDVATQEKVRELEKQTRKVRPHRDGKGASPLDLVAPLGIARLTRIVEAIAKELGVKID